MKKILIVFIPLMLLYAPTRTFYSEWGWGYYYWLMGNPIGPNWSEGLAAAGYSGLEYRGFTQFALGGWPGNGTEISSLQLRLLNNTGGSGLQIDINRVTSATPGWSECGGTAPIYLTNQPVNANQDEYTYFDLTGTSARDDFLAAWQGGSSWFGLGLKGSRGSGEPCQHFFYAFWADEYYDAALIVDYVIGVEEKPDAIAKVSFLMVEPNPFRDRTDIRFTIHDSGFMGKKLALLIYDVSGRSVKDLSADLGSCIIDQGSVVSWPGTDPTGRSVPPGVYLVALRTPSGTVYKKVVRLK